MGRSLWWTFTLAKTFSNSWISCISSIVIAALVSASSPSGMSIFLVEEISLKQCLHLIPLLGDFYLAILQRNWCFVFWKGNELLLLVLTKPNKSHGRCSIHKHTVKVTFFTGDSVLRTPCKFAVWNGSVMFVYTMQHNFWTKPFS